MIRRAIMAGGLVALTTAAALAHSGATGIVKERMDAMMALGAAAKAIGTSLRTGTPDPDAIRAAAATIRQHSGAEMRRLFPEGTNTAPSEALDRIWTDSATFETLSDQMERLAIALSAAAANPVVPGPLPPSGTDLDDAALADLPVNTVFGLLGQTCANCHELYRLPQ